MQGTQAYADRRRMNTNWYINQELGAEHRRELIALRGGGHRESHRRWHLPRVTGTHRRLKFPHSTVPREVCQ